MRNLKKWHRLGIIISIIWVIYSISVARNDEMERRRLFVDLHVGNCQAEQRSILDCTEEAYRQIPDDPYWAGHLVNALLPLAGTWILVFISLGCHRWVMRGE